MPRRLAIGHFRAAAIDASGPITLEFTVGCAVHCHVLRHCAFLFLASVGVRRAAHSQRRRRSHSTMQAPVPDSQRKIENDDSTSLANSRNLPKAREQVGLACIPLGGALESPRLHLLVLDQAGRRPSLRSLRTSTSLHSPGDEWLNGLLLQFRHNISHSILDDEICSWTAHLRLDLKQNPLMNCACRAVARACFNPIPFPFPPGVEDTPNRQATCLSHHAHQAHAR